MTSPRLLVLACATGASALAWLFRRVLKIGSREGSAPLRQEPLQATLLLPGLLAARTGNEEIEIRLHNGHDRSVCFHSSADLLVVTFRDASGAAETATYEVVDLFFPQGSTQGWLEAGATTAPYRLHQPGMERAEIAYRHVASHSTVETSRRTIG